MTFKTVYRTWLYLTEGIDWKKNWCFWIVVLEKTLESPLDCKEIKPVDPKGNQPWIFIGRIVAEAEAPMLWPSDAKSWLNGKYPNAGKDWRQEEKWAEGMGWLHSITGSMDMNLSKLWEIVEDRGAWCAIVYGVPKNWTQQLNNNNWLGEKWDIPHLWQLLPAVDPCHVQVAFLCGTRCSLGTNTPWGHMTRDPAAFSPHTYSELQLFPGTDSASISKVGMYDQGRLPKAFQESLG